MSSLELLKEEHDALEQELLELETIMTSELINYPNLVHVVKKVTYMLENHTEKEQKFFEDLESQGYTTPLSALTHDRPRLRFHLQALTKKMLTCSDCETRKALLKHGQAFIDEVRQHIKQQDWIFYALPAFEVIPIVQKSAEGEKRMIAGRGSADKVK